MNTSLILYLDAQIFMTAFNKCLLYLYNVLCELMRNMQYLLMKKLAMLKYDVKLWLWLTLFSLLCMNSQVGYYM